MEQLLTTKRNIPPTRPELVHRPRLLEKLNACAYSGCRLILIYAPAGFGCGPGLYIARLAQEQAGVSR